MLSLRGQIVYIYTVGLASGSVIAAFWATRVPWLINGHGQSIGLGKFYSHGDAIEFPDQQICYSNQNFCACWRTATFLLTLAIIPETLTVFALLFSWAFHHRKKTVLAAKYLVGASLLMATIGMGFWQVAYANITDVLATDGWKLIGGWRLVVFSLAFNMLLFVMLFHFRDIIRGRTGESVALPPDNGSFIVGRSYNGSDDSDDVTYVEDDEISVPDDIPEDQIDFYIFNKRARRQELARRL